MVTRRRFLGAAGALVGGVLLGGCGAQEARREPPSDAEVLDGLLRRELAAGAAVIGVAGSELIARQDAMHARRLAGASGIELPDDPPAAAQDVATALARKQEAVFAYVEALPRLADPRVRVLVMQIAASESEHLAALRLATGAVPVPDPFAGFTEGAGA